MITFLLTLIVGGLIGWLASIILKKDIPGGVTGNILAGIIGAGIGGKLLGHWGPEIGNVYILPALLGTIVLILVVSFIFNKLAE